MGENDLSGRVGLDTTDFKTAIAAMNREIRVIESGFKASAAALGDWAKDASGLELRIKALTSEMGAQERKVAALRAEYSRIAAEKGATSRAAQDLEIRLNKETETLNKMGVELNQTQASLDKMGAEATEAGDDVTKMGNHLDDAAGKTGGLRGALDGLHGRLGSLGTGMKALGGHVLDLTAKLAVGLAAALAGVVVGVGALVIKTAASADEMVELADKTGLTLAEIQKFKFIGDQTGTSLETVTKSMARLIKSMSTADSETGAAADAFKALGISTRDTNDELRDSQTVFGEVLEALGAIENETERDALSMALFGKSAQELNPLINAGAEGLAAMAAEAENLGAIMSDEALIGAADLNDQLAALKAGIGGLAGTVAAEFAPAISLIVDRFQEWLGSKAVQDGIKRLSDGIGRIADKVGLVVTALLSGDVRGALAEMFPPDTVTTILNIANTVQSFIQNTLIPFVTTHAEAIKGAIIAIAAVLAGAGIVALIASIANPLGLIVALVGVLGAAWAGNWGGIRDTVTAVWEGYLKPIFEQLREWLGVAIPIAIQALKNFWENVLLPALKAIWSFIQTNLIPIFQAIWVWLGQNLPPVIQALANFWKLMLLPALQTIWSFIQTYLVPLFKVVANLVGTVLALAVTALAGLWQNVLLPALKVIWSFIQTYLIPIFLAIYNNIKTFVMPILQTMGTFLSTTFVAAFKAVRGAIQWVIDKIQALINKLKTLKLPDWLIPGSPTPFELGLRGIGAAMDDLARKRLPELQAGLNVTDQQASSRGGAAPGISSPRLTIFGGIHLNGVEDRESLINELMSLTP